MAKKTETKPLPAVSVVDRRLAHPFGSPSVAITLKEGGPWEIRIVDSQLRSGRIHEMRHTKGWDFVRPEELDGTPDEYGLRAVDGRLVRGENGREVLMKMLASDYKRILDAKTRLNEQGVSGKKLAEAAAQETALKYGSQAGDAIYESAKVDVKTSRGADLELEETA